MQVLSIRSVGKYANCEINHTRSGVRNWGHGANSFSFFLDRHIPRAFSAASSSGSSIPTFSSLAHVRSVVSASPNNPQDTTVPFPNQIPLVPPSADRGHFLHADP